MHVYHYDIASCVGATTEKMEPPYVQSTIDSALVERFATLEEGKSI